jgi:hypothetical protein
MLTKFVSWMIPNVIAEHLHATRRQVITLAEQTRMRVVQSGDTVVVRLETVDPGQDGKPVDAGIVSQLNPDVPAGCTVAEAYVRGLEHGADLSFQWQRDLDMSSARQHLKLARQAVKPQPAKKTKAAKNVPVEAGPAEQAQFIPVQVCT